MKLLLTSSGIDSEAIKEKFLSVMPKNFSVAIIDLIESEKNVEWLENFKNNLQMLGTNEISVLDISKNKIEIPNKKFDAIINCGGNTFNILNRLRKFGLIDFIKNQVNNGALYIGISAGSIIAGPDIDIAGFGSEADINEIGLKDLSALNFTNIRIFPHYKDSLAQEVKEYQTLHNVRVVALHDGEAIYVENNNKIFLK